MRAVVVLSLALTAASGCHAAAAFTWSPPGTPSPTLSARVDTTAPMRDDWVMLGEAPAAGVDAGGVPADAWMHDDAGAGAPDGETPEGDAGLDVDAGIDTGRDPTVLPGCGNGRVERDETCDLGPDVDLMCGPGVVSCVLCKGCELVVVVAPPCGNGVLDPDEECDDANHDDGDGCSASCAVE